MIVVTGATGKLGRLIVEELLKVVPAAQIVATARDPAKAEALTKQGVRMRQADFAQPATLARAFEGASQVLVISSNAEAYGGDPLAQHRAAFAAARAAGARRLLYTSHMGVSATSAFRPMHNHAATEQMLREQGLAWTSLRNGFYASTVPTLLGQAAATGVLSAPADGKVSWTAHRDLATAAAIILRDEGRFEGPTPPLTAGEALDLQDIAGLLSELHGRPVCREILTDEAQAAQLAQRGLPPHAVQISLGLYRAARAGEFRAVDPALAQIVGRRPLTVRDLLAAPPEAGAPAR